MVELSGYYNIYLEVFFIVYENGKLISFKHSLINDNCTVSDNYNTRKKAMLKKAISLKRPSLFCQQDINFKQ